MAGKIKSTDCLSGCPFYYIFYILIYIYLEALVQRRPEDVMFLQPRFVFLLHRRCRGQRNVSDRVCERFGERRGTELTSFSFYLFFSLFPLFFSTFRHGEGVLVIHCCDGGLRRLAFLLQHEYVLEGLSIFYRLAEEVSEKETRFYLYIYIYIYIEKNAYHLYSFEKFAMWHEKPQPVGRFPF